MPSIPKFRKNKQPNQDMEETLSRVAGESMLVRVDSQGRRSNAGEGLCHEKGETNSAWCWVDRHQRRPAAARLGDGARSGRHLSRPGHQEHPTNPALRPGGVAGAFPPGTPLRQWKARTERWRILSTGWKARQLPRCRRRDKGAFDAYETRINGAKVAFWS